MPEKRSHNLKTIWEPYTKHIHAEFTFGQLIYFLPQTLLWYLFLTMIERMSNLTKLKFLQWVIDIQKISRVTLWKLQDWFFFRIVDVIFLACAFLGPRARNLSKFTGDFCLLLQGKYFLWRKFWTHCAGNNVQLFSFIEELRVVASEAHQREKHSNTARGTFWKSHARSRSYAAFPSPKWLHFLASGL